MKAGWKTPRFGDVCDLKKGKKPTLQKVATGGVKPYLVAKYLRGAEPSEFASVCDKNSISVSANEIIIICDGSNSGETFIGFDGILSSTMAKICHGTEIDNRFLMHFLDSLFEKFNAAKTGAAIPHLDLAALRDEILPVPEVAEQQRIVTILDEAFAGIATARAAAEQNRQNARALFESHLQSIFSQRGVGWVERRLQDVCEKITDGTHQTPTYFDEGVVFLSSRNVTSGKVDWDNVKYIDEKQHIEMHRRVAPRVNDILLAKNGTTGVAAMVDRDVVFDIYVSLALLRALDVIRPAYLLYFVNSPLAKQQFNKRLKGTGVPNLHLGEIREVVIPLPSSLATQDRVVAELDAFSAETQRLEALYQRKLEALDELRQSLLHQAFSGAL